jgi:hypothetical protein
MSIASSSVLVQLNISTWTGNKLDKDQTDRLIVRNRAGSKSAKVYKDLMAGTTLLKDVNNFAAGCRLWHNQMTLPYEDRGNRICPTSLFMDYKSQYNLKRSQFIMQVSELKDNYNELTRTARNYMGDLYNPNDYPSVDEVASKFAFELSVKPMPESGHFILDIPAQDMQELREQLDAENETRLHDASREAWNRLYKLLKGMSDKLEPVVGLDKRRWYDSFVDNPKELCTMLTHLNIMNDPELENARKMLEQTINGTNIDVIKESELERTKLKSDVDKILDKFTW